MSQLKGVVIGAGYFSQFHFDAWSRIPEAEIVAVCDADTEVAQKAASSYGIAKSYCDVDQMLDAEQPDFVDIVTRPDSHLDLVRTAARRGISIICQKPLAPTFKEAQEIVQVAAKAEVPLMIHENFRFQPWYRKIRSLMDEGLIGDRLHSISFRCRTGDGWGNDAYLSRQPYFREMPRLLIFETGVHFVDTFRYLAGSISGVYASLRKLNDQIAGEDCGTVMFEFASGARGVWDANRFNEPLHANIRLTFGEALIEGNGGSIHLHNAGGLTLHRLGEEPEGVGYVVQDRGFAGDCVKATQQHFVSCLLDKAPFETSGADYLRTLTVVEAIYDSAERAEPVRGIEG